MNAIDPFAPADSPSHPQNWGRAAEHVEDEQHAVLPGEELAALVDHLAATYRSEDEQEVAAADLLERAQAARPAGNARREAWVEYFLAVTPGATEQDAEDVTAPQIKDRTQASLEQARQDLAQVEADR